MRPGADLRRLLTLCAAAGLAGRMTVMMLVDSAAIALGQESHFTKAHKGIVFDRLFAAHPLATTPENLTNLVINRDTVKASDGITDSVVADTNGYYTFGGTKVMARIAFDPKPLLPWNFFGRRDVRIYGEMAVLGIKNYPRYYEKITERMPVMLGFNIPAFKRKPPILYH
ncbi:MAG: hypothetical protein ONB05_08355 [candidate division KSB1 bacterium]|nr:hypothetical protein [candidate division KSB1 bacterium]